MGAPWLRLSWQRREHHWSLTGLAVAAVAAAWAMAVFGLPPGDLHGPLHHMGIMDPLCGGTRAATYTARGELALAWRYNPLGVLVVLGAALLVVLGAALLVVRALAGLLLRRWLALTVTWTGRRLWLAATVATVLVTWLAVRQQLRADLLMAAREVRLGGAAAASQVRRRRRSADP